MKDKKKLLVNMSKKFEITTFRNEDATVGETMMSYKFFKDNDISRELEEAIVWYVGSQFNDFNYNKEEEFKMTELLKEEGWL